MLSIDMNFEDFVYIYRNVPFLPKRKFFSYLVGLSERMRGQSRPYKTGAIRLPRHNDIKINLNLNAWMHKQCFYFNSFEPHVFSFFQMVLNKGDNVVDVGANIGFYSLISSRLISSNGKVFSFEPVSYFYDQLIANIELNKLTNIETIKLVVSNDNKPKALYIDNQTATINLMGEDSDCLKKETVSSITLDDFFANRSVPIRLLKIDADGWDYNVLLGASDLILQRKPLIVIEVVNYGEYEPILICELLETYGYYMFYERDIKKALTKTDFPALARENSFNLICRHKSKANWFEE